MQYGNIEKAVAGLQYGTESRVMSRIAAEDLPLGYPLFQLKGEDESIALLNNDEALVDYSVDFITGNVISVTVTRPGPLGAAVTTEVSTTFDTDQATTLAALVAAVDGIDGIDCASEAANQITVSSDDGAAITVESVVTGGASQPSVTVTAQNSGNQVFRGISKLTQKDPVPYKSGDMVNILTEGRIWVYCATACQAGDAVSYNANGEFANAGTAIAGMLFESNLDAAGLALVVINNP
jgi:hypothetical protein